MTAWNRSIQVEQVELSNIIECQFKNCGDHDCPFSRFALPAWWDIRRFSAMRICRRWIMFSNASIAGLCFCGFGPSPRACSMHSWLNRARSLSNWLTLRASCVSKQLSCREAAVTRRFRSLIFAVGCPLSIVVVINSPLPVAVLIASSCPRHLCRDANLQGGRCSKMRLPLRASFHPPASCAVVVLALDPGQGRYSKAA